MSATCRHLPDDMTLGIDYRRHHFDRACLKQGATRCIQQVAVYIVASTWLGGRIWVGANPAWQISRRSSLRG